MGAVIAQLTGALAGSAAAPARAPANSRATKVSSVVLDLMPQTIDLCEMNVNVYVLGRLYCLQAATSIHHEPWSPPRSGRMAAFASEWVAGFAGLRRSGRSVSSLLTHCLSPCRCWAAASHLAPGLG
jgi:hypothetical protein